MEQESKMQNIYEDIRTKILTGVYYPGQKLSENQLATSFDCSRTPVRNILRQLVNDGLIVIKPKSGTYVKPETKNDYIEMMQVRSSLEILAYKLLLQKRTDRDIQKLEKIEKNMADTISREPIDMMKYAKYHYDFHYQFVLMSGNKVLIKMFERLNLRSSHMFYKSMDPDLASDIEEEHKKIIEFIRNKAPEGEQYINTHLLRQLNQTDQNRP